MYVITAASCHQLFTELKRRTLSKAQISHHDKILVKMFLVEDLSENFTFKMNEENFIIYVDLCYPLIFVGKWHVNAYRVAARICVTTLQSTCF